MLQGEKILVTGPAGQIAFPICQFLAEHNEVWGAARFSQAGSRERVEAAGVITHVMDLAQSEFQGLPDDFTYVLHLAAYLSTDQNYDRALTVNAEGTGALLYHCRKARGVLVMTTSGVYNPQPDPWHAFVETEALGDTKSPTVPTYSISKIAQEAVARTCARLFEVPLVIARMGAAYGPNGGLPVHHLDLIVGREPITVRWDPYTHSPIHEYDIKNQIEALLAAASVPATIVNWAGDEAVSVQEWCAYFGDLTGRTPQMNLIQVPGSSRGAALDPTKRIGLTGPCNVDWRSGLRTALEARYPAGIGSDTEPLRGAARAQEEFERLPES